MKTIKLTQGKETVVDDTDFGLLSKYKWCFDGQYAAARVNGKKVRMHRLLLDYPKNLVDHEDRDKLNNTRKNLRVVSYSENNLNTDIRADNTSGHKGISWDNYGNRWRAFVYRNGKRVNIGSFKNLTDAVRARGGFV